MPSKRHGVNGFDERPLHLRRYYSADHIFDFIYTSKCGLSVGPLHSGPHRRLGMGGTGIVVAAVGSAGVDQRSVGGATGGGQPDDENKHTSETPSSWLALCERPVKQKIAPDELPAAPRFNQLQLERPLNGLQRVSTSGLMPSDCASRSAAARASAGFA